MADIIDISDDLPYEIGVPLAGSTTTSPNVPANIRWDCNVGGIPFLFAFDNERPYIRETSDFRRQRIDTERNPGEQSLDSGYWIRSQSSWHYGAGLTSAEPLEVSTDEAQFRYKDGGGINPWTPGELTLLNSTEKVYTNSASFQPMLGVGTGVLTASGNTFHHIANDNTHTAITWGGTADILSLTSTGQYWILCDDDGIYKGALPYGTGAKIYNTAGTSDRNTIRWVKNRLMLGNNHKIHEITNIAPSSATLPSELFAHPNLNWIWTDFADGPNAIYASGYTEDTSAIYKIGVTSTSTTVTLAQPVVVAEMPRGENVLSLYSYVGSYLIIGTSKGVRIAALQTDGSLSMGPLIINTAAVDDMIALGSYLYVTVRNSGNAGDHVTRPGLYRIDLGQNISNNPLAFASAADLVADISAGSNNGAQFVTISDDKVWFSVAGSGIWRQKLTEYVSEGWIETGRVRMGTVESKAWRDLRILSSTESTGTIAAYASSNGDTAPSAWDQVISITTGTADNIGLLTTAFPAPISNLFASFKLTRTVSGSSPMFVGYQIRAIPAPRRSQLISVPILNYDFEVDRQGARYGQKNGAFARMQILRELEKNASTVTFRDYTTGEALEVYIEKISYKRVNPPTRQVSGNGGIVTILLRLV